MADFEIELMKQLSKANSELGFLEGAFMAVEAVLPEPISEGQKYKQKTITLYKDDYDHLCRVIDNIRESM